LTYKKAVFLWRGVFRIGSSRAWVHGGEGEGGSVLTEKRDSLESQLASVTAYAILYSIVLADDDSLIETGIASIIDAM